MAQHRSDADSADSAQAALVKRILRCTCYYEILGVERSASEDTIRRAYKKVALTLHPDRNTAKGAEEAFKKVNRANAVLSDRRRRQIYDMTGADPDQKQRGGMRSPRNPYVYATSGNFNTIFEELFGAMNGNFGGFTTYTYRSAAPRSAPHTAQSEREREGGLSSTNASSLLTKLFLILIFLSVSRVFSGLFTGGSQKPSYHYSLSPDDYIKKGRRSGNGKIPYYVNAALDKALASNASLKETIEAEVEYVSFRNYCEASLRPLLDKLQYARITRNNALLSETAREIAAYKASAPACIAAGQLESRFATVVHNVLSDRTPLARFKMGW